MLVCKIVALVFEEDVLAVVVVKGAHYAVGVEVKLFKAVGHWEFSKVFHGAHFRHE